MSNRYAFVDGDSIVWMHDDADDALDDSTNADSYTTAEEDTRYLSVLDTTGVPGDEPLLDRLDPNQGVAADQVVVFSVDGSDELFGVQVVRDEDGNVQKYQFQFRTNENGQLEAIPESITLIPVEEEESAVNQEDLEPDEEEEAEYAQPEEEEEPTGAVHVYVEEDDSKEVRLHQNLEEEALDYIEEVDVKTVAQETRRLAEAHKAMTELDETFAESVRISAEPDEEQEAEETETVVSFIRYPEDQTGSARASPNEQIAEVDLDSEQFEHVEVNPDLVTIDSEPNEELEEEEEDENEYQIVEGLHITGDVDQVEEASEFRDLDNEKVPVEDNNMLRHALNGNKETTAAAKIVKKDNKLYLYVVQHPEKENVNSLEPVNVHRSKVNPRSILKSSHATLQGRNEVENAILMESKTSKRLIRNKETVQAILFNNFLNKTTIPQAPVRKDRLPRKQKIRPVERMDEEIVVQEMMVSSSGFVESPSGVNKENLAVTEYVELSDSDDEYSPKKTNRKKKKHKRKKVGVSVSDDSDISDGSVIELDGTDEEDSLTKDQGQPSQSDDIAGSPPKRRRGRPPKIRSPSKKTRIEPTETRPEIPCPRCEKTFPSQNSLKTHLQYHNLQSLFKKAPPSSVEYKYKCDKCGKTFINGVLLKKHMCSKLFNCPVCKKSFPDLSGLNGHKRLHAKEQMIKSTVVSQLSPKRPKPVQSTDPFKAPKTPLSSAFKCKPCGRPCFSQQQLSSHLKTHKQFHCTSCLAKFPSLLLLQKHQREECVKTTPVGRKPETPGLRISKTIPRAGRDLVSADEGPKHEKKSEPRRCRNAAGERGVPATPKVRAVFMELKGLLQKLDD